MLTCSDISRVIRILLVAVVTVVACVWFYSRLGLHLRMYDQFCMYSSDDIRDVNQAIWNTARGKPFLYNERDDPAGILAYANKNLLHSHLYYICALIAIFYRIVPHFATFMLLQTLALAASGVLYYFICRRMLSEKYLFPFALFCIYMSYYPFTCTSHFYHPEAFAIFFLFATYLFLLKENLRGLIVCAVFAILCREENGLVLAVLGLTLLRQKRFQKYAVSLVVLGVGSFFAAKLSMMYQFKSNINAFIVHFGYLGKSQSEIICNVFLHPWLLVHNMLRPDRIALFKSLFSPVWYLCFFSPGLFMPGMIPTMEIMLSQAPLMGNLRWQPWYINPLIPFIFIALAGLIERIYRFAGNPSILLTRMLERHQARVRPVIKAISLIALGGICLSLYTANSRISRANLWLIDGYLDIYKYWYADTQQLLEGIRPDAALFSPHDFLPTLSSRAQVIPLYRLTPTMAQENIYDVIVVGDEIGISRTAFSFMEQTDGYRAVYSNPQISLFRKKSDPTLIRGWKFEMIERLRNSALDEDYVFFDFKDYAGILENAGVVSPSDFVDAFYRTLDHLQHTRLRQFPAVIRPQLAKHAVAFSSDLALDVNKEYLFVFSGYSFGASSRIYVIAPAGVKPAETEIIAEQRQRLFIVPITVRQALPQASFIIESTSGVYVSSPVIVPLVDRNIFQVRSGAHTVSYNPQAKKQFKESALLQVEYLTRQPRAVANLLRSLLEMVRLTVPFDFYTYSWEAHMNVRSEVIAVKF